MSGAEGKQAMHRELPDDLCWRAFCYVHDELPPDERAAFEQRLADDQQAREAVAEAARLTEAVRAASVETMFRPAETTALSPASTGWRPALVAVVAVAACLAVLITALWRQVGEVPQRPAVARPEPAPQLPAQPLEERQQLALAWLESSYGLTSDDAAEDTARFVGEDELLGMAAGDGERESWLPGWLLEAVSESGDLSETEQRIES